MKNYDFPLIVFNPDILGGKPCIKGTRISVDIVLEWLATGATISEICKTYSHITESGITQALLFAAHRIKNESFFEFKKSA